MSDAPVSLYQLEVKYWLAHWRFPRSEGWRLRVDVDAMERARGGSHPADKHERAEVAESGLLALGAQIGPHPRFGRADLVAEHREHGIWLVEVEGVSSRQREQAVYSALGQLLLQMHGEGLNFVLATPDGMDWERQVRKVPAHVRETLGLHCWLVSPAGVRDAARDVRR